MAFPSAKRPFSINNDTPADNAENSKAAETAENFTDEMKIPYAVDLSP